MSYHLLRCYQVQDGCLLGWLVLPQLQFSPEPRDWEKRCHLDSQLGSAAGETLLEISLRFEPLA